MVMSKPGTPASAIVGRSGASFERCAVVTASARSLPAFTCGMALARLSNMNCVSPASSACVAGAPPLNGMWTMSVPVSTLNSSPARWPALPLLPEPKIELARIRLRVRHQVPDRIDRQRRVDDQHVGGEGDQRDRREVPDRVVRHLRVQAGVHRVRGQRTHHHRVAVRRRLRHGVGADVAAGPRLVLDDDALAPRLGELLRDRPADGVQRSARRERHDELHRPGRERLRGGRRGDEARGAEQQQRQRADMAAEERRRHAGGRAAPRSERRARRRTGRCTKG